ncbi:MAG: IS110 family transposase [Candidatus Sulfotelmatobacter sp.]
MSRDIKYIGMDVHKEAVVIAVLNGSGKLVMESIVETKASSILQFIHGLQGELHVTWEEGTWASWLYDLLKPQVQEVLVCNPRRNALLKEGSKSDKVDARTRARLRDTSSASWEQHPVPPTSRPAWPAMRTPIPDRSMAWLVSPRVRPPAPLA